MVEGKFQTRMNASNVLKSDDVVVQLRAAAEILEKAASNRALLGQMAEEDRTRLLKAAGDIYCPDVRQRRRLVKATSQQRKAEKLQREIARIILKVPLRTANEAVLVPLLSRVKRFRVRLFVKSR